jgi:aspartate/methionine/tyrosine aminotransferase
MAGIKERRKYINASLGDPLFCLTAPLRHAMSHVNDSARTYHFGTTSGITGKDPYTTTCMILQDYFNQAHKVLSEDRDAMEWTSTHGLTDFMPVDGGTSRAFQMIIQYICEDVRDWNAEIERENDRLGQSIPKIKPVIIMPVPTYGHFLDVVRKNGEIEIITICRDPQLNWAVNPQILKEKIISLAKEGKRVVSYFDSNPNNPTGYVRGEKDTRDLAKVIHEMTRIYERHDRKLYDAECERTDGDRTYRSGIATRIRVIDDMVYSGLEYQGEPKAFAFCRLPEMQKYTFTLIGPSKNGLAGMRAGLIIGDSNDVFELQRMERLQGYCPSVMTMSLLSNIYNNAAEPTKWREAYQKKATTYYHYASLLTKALINGLPSMQDEIDETSLKRMVKDIRKVKSCSALEAKKFLSQGISGVEVITSPQAGFFHLVDFSGLQGKRYDDDYDCGENARVFEDEFDISRLQEKFNFAMASGQYTGLDSKKCIRRITFAMQPPEIIDMVDRIRGISSKLRAVKVAPAPEEIALSA